MHRISADNPVRRRLFPAEDDEARVQNFANILQESASLDKLEKMKKWNFDFENEVPLEGTYTWYRVEEPNEWLGIKSDKMETTEFKDNEESFLPAKLVNEATPKVSNKKSEVKKQCIRKRKRILLNSDEHAVRRRINF